MNKRIIYIAAHDHLDGNRTITTYYLTDSSPVLDTRSGGYRTLNRAVGFSARRNVPNRAREDLATGRSAIWRTMLSGGVTE